MLEAYGLALAQLNELQRNRDQAKARYDRGLVRVAVRQPGVIGRLASGLFWAMSRNRAVRSAAEGRTGTPRGSCVSPTRIAA